MLRNTSIVHVTADDALRIIFAEKALVKLIASPINNKNDENKDEHWRFLVKQLKKPHRFRPAHAYPNHDRDQKLNLASGKWEKRRGKNNKIYLPSQFKKNMQIRPKQGAAYTKKTSTTLYLKNIALYAVQNGHELGIVFDSEQCSIKAGQIWLENAVTNKRWMFVANNESDEKEFAALRKKHKPTTLPNIRKKKKLDKHNEVMARVRDPIAVFTPIYGAQNPVRRLNLITKKYLVKAWLHRDLPMLVMTTNTAFPPSEYSLEQQTDDINTALIAALDEDDPKIYQHLIADIFDVTIFDTEENTDDSYCTLLKALIKKDPDFAMLRTVTANFWYKTLLFAIKHQDVELTVSLLTSKAIGEAEKQAAMRLAISHPDCEFAKSLFANVSIEKKQKHSAALLELLEEDTSTVTKLLPGIQEDATLFVNLVGFFKENGTATIEKPALISALITLANLSSTQVLYSLLLRQEMTELTFDGHPELLLMAIERGDKKLTDLLFERLFDSKDEQRDNSKIIRALINLIKNGKSNVALDFLHHKQMQAMIFVDDCAVLLYAMQYCKEDDPIIKMLTEKTASYAVINNDKNAAKLSDALEELIKAGHIDTVINFLWTKSMRSKRLTNFLYAKLTYLSLAHEELASLLIARSAPINFNMHNKHFLVHCIEANRNKLVKYIIKKRIDVSNTSLEKALSISIAKNKKKLTQLILKIISTRVYYTWTKETSLDMMRFVIKNGDTVLIRKFYPAFVKLHGDDASKICLDIAIDFLEKSIRINDESIAAVMIKHFLEKIVLSRGDCIKIFTKLIEKRCADDVYNILTHVKDTLRFENFQDISFIRLILNAKQEKLIALLIERGMDVNLEFDNMTLIQHLIQNKLYKLANKLLSEASLSPHHLPAIILNSAESNQERLALCATRLALEKKIPCNNRRFNASGNSALHYAVQFGLKELARELCKSEDVNIYFKNNDQPTPLSPLDLALKAFDESIRAVPESRKRKKTYAELIKILLIGNQKKRLEQQQYRKIFLKLIEHGCSKQVTAILKAIQPTIDFGDDASLLFAALKCQDLHYKDEELAKFLINNGMPLQQKQGDSAVEAMAVAANNKCFNAMYAMLGRKDITSDAVIIAILYAVNEDQESLANNAIALAHQRGIHFNSRFLAYNVSNKNSQNTALHYAVQTGNARIMQTLCRSGDANITLKNANGKTAFDIALAIYEKAARGSGEKEKYACIIKILVLQTMRINQSQYITAIQKLKENGHGIIAETIEKSLKETSRQTQSFFNNMGSINALRAYAVKLQQVSPKKHQSKKKMEQGKEKAKEILDMLDIASHATNHEEIIQLFSNKKLEKALSQHRDLEWFPSALRPATDTAKLFSRSKKELASRAKELNDLNLQTRRESSR